MDNTAGITSSAVSMAAPTPTAVNRPKSRMGGMSITTKDKKPAMVVMPVASTAGPVSLTAPRMASCRGRVSTSL